MSRAPAAAIAWLVALGACQDPPLTIRYKVADGPGGYSCGAAATCSDIPMQCPSVMHLRIFSPADPTVPYVSMCEDVLANADKDLCAIARIDLPEIELPREPLEVQVTVWPREAVLDADGNLDCARTPVEFDAVYGFPTTIGPAFGGRAFYAPGDEETVVTLGCANADLVNAPTCTGEDKVDVTAAVLDFEALPLSVSSTIANQLSLAVGEPRDSVLNAADLGILGRTVEGPVPAWGGKVDIELMSTACVQVLEDTAQATASLRCIRVLPQPRTLEIAGIRMPKDTLDEILAALALPAFPDEGITIGIVVDQSGNPVAGVPVMATAGTIEYLNANRTGLATGGKTTSSGIFVSRDAPYGTSFSVNLTPAVDPAIGGRVKGKVTVVHFDASAIEPD